MEIKDILSDALVYPIHNIKSLIIYMILGIILGIALGGTLGAIITGMDTNNILTVIGSGIIGIIVALFLGFLITGYELDIIKYGIERSSASPEIDVVRQFINGVKYLVVNIVYMIIPIIIAAILAIFLQDWISSIIVTIISIIFSFALMMGQCRLAKTEDLGYALSVGEAIGDIMKIGVVKVLLFVIIIAIITFVLYFIGAAFAGWNSIVGGIIMGILCVYLAFFIARATGLLYSEV